MTWEALIQKFLEMVAKIKSLNPAYKQPGDGSNGYCDCIGLIIGALRRMGLKWTGIHGSNYAARYQTVNLAYIASESELQVGDYVYKGVGPDGKGRRPCNAGTFTHKYDLPSRYNQGKQYYNGDMLDYYHVGVVTSVNPLRITHMTSPSMKVDNGLNAMANSPWNYHGKIEPLVSAVGSGEKPKETIAKPVIETPAHTASSGTEAVVVSGNGSPVKMREYPSTSCRTWVKLIVGTKVEIVEPGEKWAKINGGGRKGWYMMAEFLDIVGDGKGKY